jgi:hypothetical protein
MWALSGRSRRLVALVREEQKSGNGDHNTTALKKSSVWMGGEAFNGDLKHRPS